MIAIDGGLYWLSTISIESNLYFTMALYHRYTTLYHTHKYVGKFTNTIDIIFIICVCRDARDYSHVNAVVVSLPSSPPPLPPVIRLCHVELCKFFKVQPEHYANLTIIYVHWAMVQFIKFNWYYAVKIL